MGATNGAVATPVTFQASWSVNMATDTDEVTAFGDPVKIYVSGLPDASAGTSPGSGMTRRRRRTRPPPTG